MNGADEGEEEKPKKTAAPKKASAAEKKVAEKKAPAKKRAPKKVPSLLLNSTHVSCSSQDAEESGEDFADEIDDIQADEDEPSEPETKKRKVCAVSQLWPSHRRPVYSELRRRLLPLSLHRRKQNRLRVVPRRWLSRLMREKKIEIYLAYVTLSSMFLIMTCGVLLPRCCPRAILSYVHVVVYRDNTICANIPSIYRKRPLSNHPHRSTICESQFVQHYINITRHHSYNKECQYYRNLFQEASNYADRQ